ncbi:MAG: universal stress protein [Streptomycetaceae bacterium]|nr:universal stress protein [Streptomycetaceae bacterium]
MTEEVVIMRGHVVVGVDGSPAADNAVDWAADEAVLRGAALEVLHAWEWTAYEASDWYGHHLYNDATEITQVAAERAMRRRPELTVHTSIVHGSAGQVLADAGERAQLTVLGSRGRGGFADLLLGSVGHEVAARGTGPLLVVRADKAFAAPPPHGEESPTPNATRVTVGIADETSLLAVEAALAEAARRRWSVYAVHAWSFPDVPAFGAATTGSAPYADAVRECQQYGESIVANTVATARDQHKELVHDVEVVQDAVNGRRTQVLVDGTRAAALVVIATHRRHGHLGRHLGPVTNALLHHSHAPVLLIPVD